ncbi:MAG TPA: M28 family peptidase, partial [Pyrinomonadaceae bacterium]|nr:M28 family peptidase [Pyrinomonadaceae bacterium]
MKQISLKLFALLLVFGNALQLNLFAQNNYGLDGEKLRERIKRLSADDFEGRGPGLAGSKRAADYIAAQLKGIGLLPGNRSSYFQEVPMVSVKADPNTKLLASASGKSAMLNFGDDFVATTGSQMQRVAIDSELVFMGYGISAPEYKWNDYKGSTNDYRGKILLIMVNDPPATAAEPNLFGGRALTYYGRWTYKYEEAARRGAAGVILIHTTESAGYGWNVVRTSFGGVRSEIFRSSSDKTPFLSVMSWTTNEAAARLLALANLNLDELRAAAASRDFKPVKTGIRVKLDLRLDLKRFSSPNILGIIPGRDPKLKNQYVVFSAHWDHLGIGEPDKKGDKIYNGAYDNASGVAALLTIAERI